MKLNKRYYLRSFTQYVRNLLVTVVECDIECGVMGIFTNIYADDMI